MKVWYYKCRGGKTNFGDVLTPKILNSYGIETVDARSPSDADLIGIGSIIHHVKGMRNGIIWSPGSMYDRKRIDVGNNKVVAIRGKLTLKRMNIKNKDDIILGDAGLLVRNLVKVIPEKKYRLGIIPHYVDKSFVKSSFKEIPSDVIVIDILAPTHAVIHQILQSEVVVSSSLHGLIAADSLKVSNRHVTFNGSKLIGGNGFKYKDYYSVFDLGRTSVSPKDVGKSTTFEEMISWCKQYYRGNIDKIISDLEKSIEVIKKLKK